MHAYAILHRSAIAFALPEGIDGALQALCCEQLAAVVEPNLTLEDVQQNDARLLEAILAHDRVIRELFGQTTVLPLRFVSFPSQTALMMDLQQNQAMYLAILAQLEGKAEFILKLVPRELEQSPLDPTLKGKDYFLAKKQQYQVQLQQQENQSQELKQIRTAIAQSYPTAELPDEQQICFLANREDGANWPEPLQRLITQSTQWQWQWSEAMPPFHFV